MARKTKVPTKKIDELAVLADWYLRLKGRTNERFMPLFLDKHRYLVLKGGGGSGKSIFAGQKILERVTSEPGHRWLVCRKVGRTIRESCWQQLIGQIRSDYPNSGYKINKSDMSISFENGSMILFSGLDDVEKLKSIYNITGIWIEEASEVTEADFNQLDIRLRGKTRYYKQIIITFNPISIMHWLKKRFWDRVEERATVHESTYKDNRFLDAEAIRVLEVFRDIDEYYYMVYCLGMWGITGKSVFDAKAVTERLMLQIQPVERGVFEFDYGILSDLKTTDWGEGVSEEQIAEYTVLEEYRMQVPVNIRFVPDPQGFVKIYKKPEKGVPYVIGADTAGDGSDCFVAQVLDNRTGEQVAVLRHRTDEDLFAKQVYCLGMYYNTALIGVEANLSTYPIRELERLNYPKQYVREKVDDYTHNVVRSFGFRTDTKTRPVIIAGLIKAVRDDITIVSDTDTLEEMLTFVRNEDFRAEAEDGAHDDCVMALAIAHYIRPQQDYLAESDPVTTVPWTESMWEDYQRASDEERRYLVAKWGHPQR